MVTAVKQKGKPSVKLQREKGQQVDEQGKLKK
jgi:hypothetical protein